MGQQVTKIFIEELSDQLVDGDVIGLFTEGEFSDSDFLIAASTYLAETYGYEFKIVEPVTRVRWRRHSRGEDGDEMKPGRGAGSFAATTVKVQLSNG